MLSQFIHVELLHAAASPGSDWPPSCSSSANALLAACWQKPNSARAAPPAYKDFRCAAATPPRVR